MIVLYEDNHLLVIEKPVNIPVQADASGDLDLLSMAKAYIKEKYQKPGAAYVGLVHRLDRPVGGVMVFAKTSKAAARLSEQVRLGTMGRMYVCVVKGMPQGNGELTHWLLKNQETNTSKVVSQDTKGAKYASLSYEPLAYAKETTLVKVELHTGRSHQIRVQFAEQGSPLWGDVRYGKGKPGDTIALFACSLSLEHPITHEKMVFSSVPPSIIPWNWFSNSILGVSYT